MPTTPNEGFARTAGSTVCVTEGHGPASTTAPLPAGHAHSNPVRMMRATIILYDTEKEKDHTHRLRHAHVVVLG